MNKHKSRNCKSPVIMKTWTHNREISKQIYFFLFLQRHTSETVQVWFQAPWQSKYHNKMSHTDFWFPSTYKSYVKTSVVKNPSCYAKDTGFNPWSRKIPHAEVTKPMCHNYWAPALQPMSCNYWSLRALRPVPCNKRSQSKKKHVHSTREQSPLAATRESPQAATKSQHSQKKNFFKSGTWVSS